MGELRALLARERAAIEGAHCAGMSGRAVVRRLSDLVDRVVEEALARADPAPAEGAWALVALGGYGRRELSPHSDVDVMLLHEAGAARAVEPFAAAVFRALWDVGLHLGHAVRTVSECLEVAERDLSTCTSLLEARPLAGSAALVEALASRLRSAVAKRRGEVLRRLVEELRRGTARHGSSLYMLEPNVKRSGGGLRTLQFGRWIALARHGTADLGVLHARGLLTPAEGRALREAQEFYWRVRNDLHFAAGHAADTVSFDDQVRLARTFGYRDDDQRLGVERFMQRYYLHATDAHEIVERFVARTARRPLRRGVLRRVLARRAEEIFLVAPDEITLAPGGREALLSDPLRVLALFGLHQIHGRPIHHALLDDVRSALEVQGDEGFRTPEAAARFREILSRPGRLADTLSLMHRTGALWKLLPEFEGLNRLVQFNRFHKYTVDEHTFAVIRAAEGLLESETEGRSGVRGPREPAPAEAPGWSALGVAGGGHLAGEHLRRAYRQVKRKDVLHLAMLLHDVGKGREGDHSAAGAGIAAAVARRLGYGEHDARLLVFLVREHLTMEQVALRRDLADEKVLLRFARTVANPETLRMLFVLTCADLAGVGQGNWTSWKADLLTTLYLRAIEELAGSREVAAPAERLASLREDVLSRLAGTADPAWLEENWAAMNERYLLATPPETIVSHLEWLAELPPADALVKAANLEGTGTTVYTVLAHDAVTPGVFARIAGALAAKGLQVLRARLDTRANGTVVDTFDVTDEFYAGPPPAERLEEVCGAIRDALLGSVTVEELFARHRRFEPAPGPAAPRDPAKVEIDNESSDDFTVVEVFAQDKQGLLYVIASALRDLGLSVHSAKVATRLDQVLDVFYVTGEGGGPVTDSGRLEVVTRTLVERIETYERRPAS